MNCDFEEGEYRAPLFNQLEFGSHLLWEPGQVFEEAIGIDRASHCLHNYFWQLHGYTSPLLGIIPRRYSFPFIWNKIKKGKILPDFSLNVFIQAKRPKYSKYNNKNLNSYGIKGRYWYFEITDHQQIALQNLSSHLGSNALIVYACPTFHEQQHLYNHTSNRTIVENSTFPEANRLTGHKKWYYNSPGTNGTANPDFEYIEGPSFQSLIQQKKNNAGNTDQNSPIQNLKLLYNGVIRTTELQTNRFESTQFAQALNEIDNYLENYGLNETEGFKEILAIYNYCILWKLNWLTF